MYLVGTYWSNAKYNLSGKFFLQKKHSSKTIAKWTCLSSSLAHRELLKLFTLCCVGDTFLNLIDFDLQQLCRNPDLPLQLEFIIARHQGLDGGTYRSPLLGKGLKIGPGSRADSLSKKDFVFLPATVPRHKIKMGSRLSANFMLAYGNRRFDFRRNEKFDFSDRFFRMNRFHTLFSPGARLTNPTAFLARLNYKGIRKGRFPAKQTLKTLCELFTEYLSIDTKKWLKPDCNFRSYWLKLHSWQQRAVLPLLDMTRHMVDAFPHSPLPLEMPGVILLDCPDRLCTEKRFADWITLLDLLIPRVQFILSAGVKAGSNFPGHLLKKRLSIPEPLAPKKNNAPIRIGKRTVLLIDVDGRLPNLALMKLGRYYKNKGQKVVLGRRNCYLKGVQKASASSVFFNEVSDRRTKRLRKFYGSALNLGGSGVDIRRRLPEKIESLRPDYSLYPELGDRAIGFITRGCPNKCPFCIVPEKEGAPRQVCDLDMLTEGGRRKKLILLDDNILAHPAAETLLEEMAARNLQVNFTQTIDIRLVNRERALLLRRIRCANTRFTRTNYHFSLNDNRKLSLVERKYRLFGFTHADNVEFVCMYGYNTTLAQDVKRFRFLRSLPGAYVFVQKYRPILGGPPPETDPFFGSDPDPLIDELVGILFPQNMKSMESYYRWLSKGYATTFGKLHMGLVDTIFRYNHRFKKGEYIATLAGTKQ